MLRKLKEFWNDWGGLVIIVGLALSMVGLCREIFYSQTHQTVDLGEGIEAQVAGRCWYLEDDPKAGGKNQFYASNELGFSAMSMEPHFTIVNTSTEPREVAIYSLSAWRVPISGKAYLEPGQRFEFQIHGQYKHWYCWINPLPKKIA